jgi:hypothetical protein
VCLFGVFSFAFEPTQADGRITRVFDEGQPYQYRSFRRLYPTGSRGCFVVLEQEQKVQLKAAGTA